MAISKALEASIANVPSSIQGRMREGFSHLASLAPDVRSELLSQVAEILRSGASTANLEPLVALTSLKTPEVASIVTALSATIGIAAQDGATTEDFLAASRGKFFDAADEPVVAAAVDDAISRSEQWNSAFDKRRLANETLPALAAFDLSIDLRLRFDGENIEDGVPVALVHVDTDTTGQEVWFQAGRGDVRMMLERLQRALRQMELAEELYKKRSE